MNDWKQCPGITVSQYRSMMEWDRRRRCPWLYKEVQADDPSGIADSQVTDIPATGSAPVAGVKTETEE